MECKECNSDIKEGAAFCGVCGAKVEQSLDSCKNCGESINKDAKFCRKCGEPTQQLTQQSDETPGEESETVVIDEDGIIEVAEEEVAVIEETVQAETKPTKGKKNKKIIFGAIIAVALILVVTRFGGSPNKAANRNQKLLMFEKDYEDIYAKPVGKAEYILKAADASKFIVSEDGKKIYSIDDDSNLYVQEGNKSATKISSDVDWLAISPSGETIAYVKDADNYGVGELYVKSGAKEADKVASDGCAAQSVSVSQNGKYVAFTEVDEASEEIRTYLYKIGGVKTRIGKHISIGVNDKGDTLAVSTESDIYMIKKGKEADKITSDPDTIVANKDFSSMLILEGSGNLYSYKGRDKEKIEGNVDGIAGAKGTSSIRDELFVQTNTKKLDVVLYKGGDMYVKFDGKESEKVANSGGSQWIISDDYSQVINVANSKLNIKNFKNGKIVRELTADVNPYKVQMTPDGSHIAYIKEGDLYTLKKGQKTGTKVEAKDDVVDVGITDKGIMYYETEDGRLFATKGKKAGNKIADDIYTWKVIGEAVYVLNYEDALYETKGTKKTQKVTDDVSDFIYIDNHTYNISGY